MKKKASKSKLQALKWGRHLLILNMAKSRNSTSILHVPLQLLTRLKMAN